MLDKLLMTLSADCVHSTQPVSHYTRILQATVINYDTALA